jgi:hypothetical protein
MHDARPRIDLLLVNADDRAPILSGVDRVAAGGAPAPEPRPKPGELWADEDAPDDLVRQRWGILAPAGSDGDRLLDAIAPLVEHRRRQQGPVRVHRVPARMTAAEALRWKKRVFRTGADLDCELPRYQLILGDLDQVPLVVQQVQASDGFVGRIAFDELDGYRAYATKVVRWENRPAPVTEAHAILHAVRDGTSATRLGVQALITPAADLLRRRRGAGDVRFAELRVTGSERPSPDELLAAAAIDRPGVLLSLGHGVGVARSGGASRQRREQGALSFGRGGLVTGADLAGRGFLPGGVWLAVACFAAGTPETSDYRHWLDTIRRAGHVGSETGHVLDTLAHDRPFVAALPKAVLADPDGPLAFVGHVDLAWAYSFFDLDDRPRRRPGRIAGVLQAVLNGHRAGVAVRKLMQWFAEVNTELTALDDARARRGGASFDDREQVRRGHLWMLRQDLAGYALLGDPAIRLPISRRADGESGRAGEHRTDGAHAAAVARAEAAVLAVLRGEPVAEVARRHAQDRAELARCVARFCAAGRAALAAALPGRAPDQGP